MNVDTILCIRSKRCIFVIKKICTTQHNTTQHNDA